MNNGAKIFFIILACAMLCFFVSIKAYELGENRSDSLEQQELDKREIAKKLALFNCFKEKYENSVTESEKEYYKSCMEITYDEMGNLVEKYNGNLDENVELTDAELREVQESCN